MRYAVEVGVDKKIMMLLMIGMLILASCSGSATQAVQNINTLTPAATTAMKPTLTATALPTQRPTKGAQPSALPPTLTPTEKPTLTPTAGPLTDAAILSTGFLSNWRYLVIIQAGAPLDGEFYAIVDVNKPYKCEIRSDYPDRLYCFGRQVRFADWAPIAVYNSADELLFEGEFFTPMR
mgnify:CR=1 FL=1